MSVLQIEGKSRYHQESSMRVIRHRFLCVAILTTLISSMWFGTKQCLDVLYTSINNDYSYPLWNPQKGPQEGKDSTTTTINDGNGNHDDNDKVLYLIFAGGKSSTADMNAILDTWGKKVNRALIMTNTPEYLPLERIKNLNNYNNRSQSQSSSSSNNNNNNEANIGDGNAIAQASFLEASDVSWKIHFTSTLDGGGLRKAFPFWNETFQLLNLAIKRNPQIEYVVRSDSDTWWNADHLREELFKETTRAKPKSDAEEADDKNTTTANTTASLLPSNDPAMMGQFYGLVDLNWKWRAAKPRNGKNTKKFKQRDDGRNAYLTGGSGVVFTKAAIQTYASCPIFSDDTVLDVSNHTTFSACRRSEDVWLSCAAYHCGVSLVHNGYMFQELDQLDNKSIPILNMSQMIAIHRAAGSGRKGSVHPSFYENQLLATS